VVGGVGIGEGAEGEEGDVPGGAPDATFFFTTPKSMKSPSMP